MYNLLCIFLTFLIYSIIGYVSEVIFCSIKSKKFIWNRGFLIGPYLPIYGNGALIITHTLGKYSDDVIALFIMSMVYCTILEYFTSLILEKLFHLRWWDYSEKKFNLNGRVCLTNGLLFGIAGIVILDFINPLITNFVYSMNSKILVLVCLVLLVIFLTDLFVSIRIVFGLKTNISKITSKDATKEIKKEVSLFLKNYGFLTSRLLKSYPNLVNINNKRLSNAIDYMKTELRKRRKTK